MSEEIKINKHSGSITFTNNGISFSQSGIAKEILDLITNLQQKVEQLENIRKEAIEMFKNINLEKYYHGMSYEFDINNFKDDLLNILNKGGEE